MNDSLRASIFLTACVLLFGECLHGTVYGQSDSDLRRQNQRLQTEVEDLTRELEAAQQVIADLQREVALLRRELEAAGRDLPPGRDRDEEDPDRGPASVDETDPSTSPRALLAALQASYTEALGDKEIGAPRTREREQFIRALQQWRDQVHREHRRMLIEWHVRIVDATPTEGGYAMRLLVIDPQNLAELGAPFTLNLHRRMARRYEQLAARGEVGLFVLRGTMSASVNINESRISPGPFNNPPFIGRFAEFGFTIEPRSLMPANEDER